MEANQPLQREFLAEMLWPDRPEGAARANLRHTLGDLHAILGGPESAPRFLSITRRMIQLNPAADLWMDTTVFTGLIAGSIPVTKLPIERLEEAVNMYRGCFLEDLSLRDSASFHEWVLLKREQFQSQVLKALSQLTKCYIILGKIDRAHEYARRQVALAPWDEVAHQQVMRCLALTGQVGAALDYYEKCRAALQEELGAEPGRETLQLYEKIRSGKSQIRAVLPTLSHFQEAIRLPAFLSEDAACAEPPVFVARERELAKLEGLLREMLQGQGRMAFLTGDAGQGKTALMDEFARRAMQIHPELLVASGKCNALAGSGDPYLPFRDVMAMLSGDVENRWAAGSIGKECARRLWKAQTITIQAWQPAVARLIDTIFRATPYCFALQSPRRHWSGWSAWG